jgi:hypothetical protein
MVMHGHCGRLLVVKENEFKIGESISVSGSGCFIVEEVQEGLVWMSDEDGGERCAPPEYCEKIN